MPETDRSPLAAETVAGADANAEYKAFETWARSTLPFMPVPLPQSHLFDAWMASARHRPQPTAAHGLADEALRAVEPYLDAITCYASTIDEHEGNRIAKLVREACRLHAWKALPLDERNGEQPWIMGFNAGWEEAHESGCPLCVGRDTFASPDEFCAKHRRQYNATGAA